MDIYITGALGAGGTPMSAFDDALLKAGVANFNLVRLSSVIPPESRVIIAKPKFSQRDFGQKLVCVYAAEWAKVKGESAYAGIGWIIDRDRKGLFVEHEGRSRSEVERMIKTSLTEMVARRPGFRGKSFTIRHKVIGGRSNGKHCCALMVAAYQVERF